MSTKKEEIRALLVCVGYAMPKGHKSMVPTFRRLVGDATSKKYLDEPYLWSKIRKARPGGVYSIAVPSADWHKTGTVYMATLRYVCDFYDEKQVAEWEAHAETQRNATEIEAKARKMEQSSGIRSALLPLRIEYQKLNARGRAALIGWLVSEVARAPSYDEGGTLDVD